MSAASGSKNNEGSSQSYFAERNIENSNNSNKHDNSIKLRRSINEKHGLAFISASAFTAGALGAIYIINRQQNKASENESRDLHAKAPAAETVEQKQKAPQARLRPISAALNRFSGPSLGFAALLVSSVLTVSLFAASISIAKIYLGVENVTTRVSYYLVTFGSVLTSSMKDRRLFKSFQSKGPSLVSFSTNRSRKGRDCASGEPADPKSMGAWHRK